MINVLKEIILDFQNYKYDSGIKRKLNYSLVKKKAFICIGVRRCGKSTLLYQILDNLLKSKINIENVLYINFFDDRLTELKKGNLNLILDAYFSLYPDKKNSEKIYCFFDEIQETENWEPFIDRILRTENAEVFITGSSAKMLSKEIATQMRGRSISWELFPFSFSEYLEYKNFNTKLGTSAYKYKIIKLFDKYFKCGGFPEVFKCDNNTRIMIHQEYYKAIIHRDVIERFDVIHPKAVIQLTYRLISSVSSLYTINRLTDYLKSIGFKLSKTFVSDVIDWLEDSYFLFSVKKFDKSISKQNVNAKKIYCIDHGIINSIIGNDKDNKGYALENIVFTHLRKITTEIFYYKTLTGKKVDFLYWDEHRKKQLLQVSWSLTKEPTRKREINSLIEAMTELKIHKALVITYNEEETIEKKNKIIKLIPAYKFLTINS